MGPDVVVRHTNETTTTTNETLMKRVLMEDRTIHKMLFSFAERIAQIKIIINLLNLKMNVK